MLKYQIIIPMSGFGERFRRAGYKIPKPLIEIEGKPIIAHIIDMFGVDNDFIFICNDEHLENPDYKMREILNKYAALGTIVGIAPHKLGPVNAVLQVAAKIDLNKPTIVNYCDFTCYWDFADFKRQMQTSACAGSIVCYKGFHPHYLGTTNYAYVRDQKGWAYDIQEKQPFTDNRQQEFASSGTYYFSDAKAMLTAMQATVANHWHTNGEYYVSLVYKYYFQKNAKVLVYPLQHFMQWGTPKDVAEYQYWSQLFKLQTKSKLVATNLTNAEQSAIVIPMAGLGQRFADEGYTTTKPLIEVSGAPMVLQVLKTLPKASEYVIVVRKDMPQLKQFKQQLLQQYQCTIIELDAVTDGQARTTAIGVNALAQTDSATDGIIVGACDFAMGYNTEHFAKLQQSKLGQSGADLIVWGYSGHPHAIANPQQYGWVTADESANISDIAVKQVLNNPETDSIILGCFWFKNKQVFEKLTNTLFAKQHKVNGEYYLDSTIDIALELGMSVKLCAVDYYLSWGTPNDLRCYNYWQSCFHKWQSHCYSLEQDALVASEKIAGILDSFEF